jgi:hypothetical protein
MSALQNLQTLLCDLFQLDSADLDFGIYRLFQIKRDEIEAFLGEQLPRRVGEAFQAVADEERAALESVVSNQLPFKEQGILLGGYLLTGTALDQIPDIGRRNREDPPSTRTSCARMATTSPGY